MKYSVFKLTGVLLLVAIFAVPLHVHAIAPFGGQIIVKNCKNKKTKLVTVGPPAGGVFIFGPQTREYDNQGLSSGEWILGLYGSIVICKMGTKKLPFPGIILNGSS